MHYSVQFFLPNQTTLSATVHCILMGTEDICHPGLSAFIVDIYRIACEGTAFMQSPEVLPSNTHTYDISPRCMYR